ncbi:hypothetical protein DWY69_06035 [Eisenbergiella massiliensis]|uniref:Uncharacterized protein n=1 Tax=Eisenbergiella massiliensis TaxID=1720294 RepID=A0A3E3J133_9FIRM|nr:hypothetical protein DXC51_02205 [Eisenbergiella massiliensis]RGE73044.1 hypothetical protein DWY69_06035 [Eisenbergiella massiliensis]
MKLRTNLLWMLLALFISIIENEHLYLNAAFHIPYIFVTLLQLKKRVYFGRTHRSVFHTVWKSSFRQIQKIILNLPASVEFTEMCAIIFFNMPPGRKKLRPELRMCNL